MEKMKEFLNKASRFYYEGNPIISDETFDTLSSIYNSLDVGYHVKNGIPHYSKMYSLQKCYDLAKAPFPISNTSVTPKLDGLAVSLLYVDGRFQMGLTRGDGNLGHDITEKLAYLVPTELEGHEGVVQVTGEVIAPKDIPNARNFAAGTMNLKDWDKFLTQAVDLQFYAYDMDTHDESTYFGILAKLESYGFNTVGDVPDIYPTDGQVYRVSSNAEFERMGYTSHHPRGAFAFKTQAEGRITQLIDVEWQVGRSGVVSPVAILKPVKIGEATVSRATLHNQAFIENLDLEIGCDVEVIRSGEIIPCILRKVPNFEMS